VPCIPKLKFCLCATSAIILSRPFDLPSWLTVIIRMLLPYIDGHPLISKIAVAALDSFWRSHRELRSAVAHSSADVVSF
jgi:hypothetical protein